MTTEVDDPKAAAAPQPDPNNPAGHVPDKPEVDPPDPNADPDPIEQLALEMGWNPDFDGPKAVDARTYIKRGRDIQDQMADRLRQLKRSTERELAAMREGIDTIRWSAEQASKQKITQLQAEISDLKAKRRAAVQEGQVDTVEAFDQQIESRQNAMRAAEAKPPTPRPNTAPNEVWNEWLGENVWYNTDADLKVYADNLSGDPKYQAMPFEQRIERIAKVVREMYPEKFTTKQPAQPSAATTPAPAAQPHSAAVAPVSPSHQRAKPKGKTKATAADLSYNQTNVGKDLVSLGVYKNLDEYAQALADSVAGKGGA